MKKKSAEPKAALTPAPLAYVGPTIPGVAVYGEVYTNGLPAAVAAAAAEKPLFNKLIVPLPEMPYAQRDIILKEGAYYAAFRSVKKGGI